MATLTNNVQPVEISAGIDASLSSEKGAKNIERSKDGNVSGTLKAGGAGGAGGGSDAGSEGSKASSKATPVRKTSQWNLVRKKLNIRGGFANGGPGNGGGGGSIKNSLTTANPMLSRTASKRSLTTTTNTSINNYNGNSNGGSNAESVRVENTYQLGPHRECTFRPLRVHREVESLVEQILDGERYDSTRCGAITVRIADVVKDKVKTLGFSRHKLVVQTILSSASGQSLEVASRCLWNAETDNYTTVVYRNASIFAVVSVYGLYYE